MTDTCTANALADAIEFRKQGNYHAALAALQTVATSPQTDVHYQMGLVYYQQKKFDQAVTCLKKALEIQPDDINALLQTGICFNDLKQYSEAKSYCQRVVELDPTHHQAWGHLGKACVENDEFEEGVYHFHRAFKLAKRTAYARGLAKAYRKSGRHDYAVNILRQVLGDHPEDHEARFSLGLSLMHLEKFPEALDCLESRLHLAEIAGFRTRLAKIFALPAYNGENLADKSLLVFTEQGYGDIIQFSRYLKELRPKTGRLMLWCREGLAELLQHNFALDFVTENLAELPAVDFRLPLMSIPRFFDRNFEFLEESTPYLTAPPGRTTPQRDDGKLKVGLVWGAEPLGFDYNQKRVPLAQLAPLFEIPNVQWHSLQVGHDSRELPAFKHSNLITDLSPGLKTFADTARAVSGMDLIITCDTSVAHLAGAMGKPLWVMLKMDPDWRWQADGQASRWYPTSRLYRQYARNSWEAVVKRIHKDLSELAKTPAPAVSGMQAQSAASPFAKEKLALASRATAAKNHQHAIEIYKEILAREPGNANVLNELGVAWYREGNLEEARRFFAQAVASDPDYPRALTNLGACHNELNDNPSAIDCYEKALVLQPDMAAAWGNMAKAWSDMEEFEMAVYCYRKAIAIKPEAEFHRGLSKAYRKSGRYDRSEQILNNALAKAPNDADAHFGQAVTLFHLEKYPEAVREFEWRRKTKEMIKHEQDLYPIFRDTVEYAGQDLSNSTLLLHTEQGFGDNLQFVRFIHQIRPKVKRLVMWCRPGLGALFKHCFGLDEVSENVFKLPGFDYHLPLLSVPYHFDPSLASLEPFSPYLFAPYSEQAFFTPDPAKLNIGLVWGASDSGFDHANKRIPLSQLKPLLEMEGIRWHSLQMGSDKDDIANEGLQDQLVDHSKVIGSFADTAQIVSQLDLVISCDTAVAHLAGAMGKPTWLMLKKNPDWRWHADGESSIWYPSARLYRQDSYGDWSSVIRRVARDLTHRRDNGTRAK